jgi:hypothetical protein
MERTSLNRRANDNLRDKEAETMKVFRVCISLIVVLAVVATILNGCGHAKPTPTTYSITGTVTLSGTGLQGVIVTLAGASSATVTTDASGSYSFTGLANGSYTITPSKSGYTFSPSSSAQTLNGADITAVNFTATALTYSITGTVTLSGTGLQGVIITLAGASSATVTTDASGSYSFTGLANRNYTITPSKSGYTVSPSSSAQTVNGANITGVSFTATATGYSISGTVTFSGIGFPGVTMTLTGAGSASVTTDASGNYTFGGLANGSYTVTPSKSSYTFTPSSSAQTANGANIAGVNFTATGPGYSISGSVSLQNGGARLQGVMMTISTNPPQTTTTDANGNYSISNMPNGTYTLTPSLSGAEAIFYPASMSVTVNGNNVPAQFFGANVGYTVSGTVTYSGAQTGRVYVNVDRQDGGGTGLGTSVESPGSFTIRGVPPGTYTLSAWMDSSTPQTGAPNALCARGQLSVSVTSGNVSGQSITLTDPSPTPAPSAPANVRAFPSNGSAIIVWDAPLDASGNTLAQYYHIYYSNSSSVSPATETSKEVQARRDLQGHVIISGLTDGTTYYFIVTAVLGGVESSASTPPASAIIGATAGSNSISGTVAFATAATGPMYVVLVSNANEVFFQRIANPVSPQSYSISGVPSGTYTAVAVVDMNDNGVVDTEDISNTNGNGITLDVSGNISGVNQTLSDANALAQVITVHSESGLFGDSYGLYFPVSSNVKLAVNVALSSGPNVPVPMDMSVDGNSSPYISIGAVRPDVGDAYLFAVGYSDGTSENLTASVTAVVDSAQGLTTSGTDPYIPAFSWTAPALPPASYSYYIMVSQSSGQEIWFYPLGGIGMPSSQTSVLFNVDGTASQTSLTKGTLYNWSVIILDSSGNRAYCQTSYTPSGPPIISLVDASAISTSEATITWTTDEAATSQVEYGLTTSYGSTTTLDTNLVTSHSVSLSGLSAATPYHYRVKSKDASQNEAVSDDFTFITEAATTSAWTWQNPLPQGNLLTSVWGSSASDVFAVGSYGTILHYDGSSWSAMSSGTTDLLSGVWGSSPTDVFAVGGWWTDSVLHGTILHYNGNAWSVMSSGTNSDLVGVWGSSPTDVFAVGDTVFHYNGSTWSAMSSGTTRWLWGVWGNSATDVFVVGWGVILHYNGGALSAMSSGTTDILYGVWGSSATDVFAVGDSGIILHCDGSGWKTMSSGTTNYLSDVWGSSATNVFAVGWGNIIHYDGSAWSAMNSPSTGSLQGVWGSSATDAFAVGLSGTILHYS